jgi:hypothetical protein
VPKLFQKSNLNAPKGLSLEIEVQIGYGKGNFDFGSWITEKGKGD